MSEIKVRLSLSVPGAQRVSWEEAQKHPHESYDTHRIKVSTTDKRGHSQTEIVVVKTLKQRMVKQNIQISKEAYDYMLETPPERIKGWASMKKNERLNYHFRAIAESLGAKDYSFEVLED